MIDEAILFAAKAHQNEVRKGNGQPYIFHPIEVLSLVSLMSKDDEVLCAAVLHDTVEDTDVTREQIEAEFGSRVAALVAAESENKREDQKAEDTWKIRKQETIDHLRRTTDRDVKILSLADKLSNLRAIHRDYMAIGDKLWDRFHQKDPKEIGWYYRSFEETCAELKKTAAYQEYVGLLDKVFGRKK
jgi:myo-inositol-1(or 4)-monophosphatase